MAELPICKFGLNCRLGNLIRGCFNERIRYFSLFYGVYLFGVLLVDVEAREVDCRVG